MSEDISEQRRLEALWAYEVLDTPSDRDFDRIVNIAATITAAPVALISFVDKDRQWFKASVGIALTETDRAESLCDHTIQHDDVLVVSDLQDDPRFRDSDVMRFDRSLRFYAGAPLIVAGGHRLGTLCVLDGTPRHDFGPIQQKMLADLAALVVNQLDLRRDRLAQIQARREADLMRAIQSVLVETTTFGAALDATIRQILEFCDGILATVWERRPQDELAHLIAVTARGEAYADLPPFWQRRPVVPAAELSISRLFGGVNDTLWERFTPDDDRYPLPALLRSRGLFGQAASAVVVGGRHFVITVAVGDANTDLAAMAGLLGRLSPIISQVMQRKLADEQLALLGSALAATHDSIMIYEVGGPSVSDHRIIFVNAATCRQTGYSEAELLGQHPSILHGPETDSVERQRLWDAIDAGHAVRSEMKRHRRDGSSFWSELTLVPIVSDQGLIHHWVGIQRDVSEKYAAEAARHAREQELLTSQARLRSLTEELTRTQRLAKVGAWRRVGGSTMMGWSETTYAIFGVSPQSFTPTVEAVTAMIHPDDRAQLLDLIARANVSQTDYTHEYRVIGPDGIVRHLWSEARFERDENGQVIAYAGVVQDITRRKQAEAMILRNEKLRSIGQLTGGIAHDFNNLLTIISVNLEMLGEVLGEDHPAEGMRAMAARAAQSGADLTANLLSFARRQPLQPYPIDINHLLGDIRLLAERSLGSRHVIDLHGDAAQSMCLLDRAGFEGAMLNLLVNSRDAMPDGGTITITTSNRILAPSDPEAGVDHPGGPMIVVTIADTGYGIPAGVQDRVFEPFFTTKTAGKGTGLGLSSVLGFIRQSGGQVNLASTPNVGTTVTLLLPALIPAA